MVYRRGDDTEGGRLGRGSREDNSDAMAFPPENSDLPATVVGGPGSAVPSWAGQDAGPSPSRPSGPGSPLAGGQSPYSNLARGDMETVVGRGSDFDGKLKSPHSIRVQGNARGEIESEQAVFVEEGAHVSAKITAAEITIAGHVEGQLFSSGRVEIKPRGEV